MAVRYQAEFKTSKGVEYRVNLHDSSHTGAVTTVRLGGNGFRYDYDSENKERTNPVMPSRCTVGIFLENLGMESIVTDIISSAENRFSILIEKKISGTYTLDWFGNVISEVSSLEDLGYPYLIELTATDGLGSLKDIDYKNGNVPYTGVKSLHEHLNTCLNKIANIATAFPSGSVFTETAVNWYSNGMSAGLNNDPLALAFIDSRIFVSYDDKGEEKYMSCYDVIVEILTAFMCRIYFSEGRYIIEQINERVNASTNYRRYEPDGSLLSASADAHDFQVSQSANGARLEGGSYTFFPPLKEVKVTLNTLNSLNLVGSVTLDTVIDPPTATILKNAQSTSLDIPEGGGDNTLRFQSSAVISGQYVGTALTGAIQTFVKIRFQLVVGDKWLKRTYSNGAFSTPEWVDALDYYEMLVYSTIFYAVPMGSGSFICRADFSFETPPLESGGVLKLGYRIQSENSDFVLSSAYFVAARAAIIRFGQPNIEEDFVRYSAVASGASTKTQKIETRIGDGTPSGIGNLRVSAGAGIYTPTSVWGLGSATPTLKIGAFLAQTVLAGQDTPVRKYLGSLFGEYSARKRAYWPINGINHAFLFAGGTYRAKMDEWDGEWHFIRVGSAGFTTSVKKFLIDPNGTGLPTGGGQTGLFERSAPGGVGGTPLPQAFSVLAGATTAASYQAGSITSLSVNEALAEGAFPDNSEILIVNPVTGATQSLTVTSPVTAGDTSIAVSGTLAADFPSDSYIIYPQSEIIQQAGGGLPTGGGGGGGDNWGTQVVEIGSTKLTGDGTTSTPLDLNISLAGLYGSEASFSGNVLTVSGRSFTSYSGTDPASNTIPDTDILAACSNSGTAVYLKTDRGINRPITIFNVSTGNVTVNVTAGSGHNIRNFDGSNITAFTLPPYRFITIYRASTLWRMSMPYIELTGDFLPAGTTNNAFLRYDTTAGAWQEVAALGVNSAGNQIRGTTLASLAIIIDRATLTLVGGVDNGAHVIIPAHTGASEPSPSGNGQMWAYLPSGTGTQHRIKFRGNDIAQQVATVEADFSGSGTVTIHTNASTGGTYTLDYDEYGSVFDGSSGAISVKLNRMREGREYAMRIRDIDANGISIDPDYSVTGWVLEVDGDNVNSRTTTYQYGGYPLATDTVVRLKRIQSTIFVSNSAQRNRYALSSSGITTNSTTTNTTVLSGTLVIIEAGDYLVTVTGHVKNPSTTSDIIVNARLGGTNLDPNYSWIHRHEAKEANNQDISFVHRCVKTLTVGSIAADVLMRSETAGVACQCWGVVYTVEKI